ncbi:bifunctional acetate--CoA ligase family protein/GNAT family N-acetyltransferase [Nocardioides jiangxiensis]|uniref:GNAT family N-acetyltransferase n=1 Tax=Nocardioides jiangxiensis TaxID=3064524 RepID=A0ABT9B3N2_9ACTN|nr:bifunctional GNAT family N-acetyltransferase/acetate--CoA ligase family protein [Nocardioides sp. WY-20]MDO7869451.1 GNAT family N-acetyltransferase [Nocardioides sp. WY-20]
MSEAAPETPLPPHHWEADVLLLDGGTAHIRPIRPDDAAGLEQFYARVSDRSKYYRFFAPRPKLSTREIAIFTRVDHTNRIAFVMELAGRIIAVGRFDVVAPGEAEVAFLVEDRHQGRGIAQILLEHLAQAGRERGVRRFTADVLPDNKRMIATFEAAGYQVMGGVEDGVMTLGFDIDPTTTAIGVMQDREHRSESAAIAQFLAARSVAVIGASRRQGSIGQALVRNLVTGDFTGRVYAVNPAGESVSGLAAYATVGEIPDEVDLAIVAVPADAVQDVVLDCAAKGVKGLVVISSGFAETGDEGRQRQRKLVGLARSYGLRLIGPNCLGVINTDPDVSINASLSPHMPARGRAGFFCQSGALGSAILDKVNARGLGLSTFVSAGNRADVSGNDLLQYWEEDDSTEVVLLYMESMGNPRKFSRIARRVSRKKPIVAVRSGRTTQGVPMGHQVRTAMTPPGAVDAMFRQAGVIQVDTLEEMFDVAQVLAHQPLPGGRRVAIVGNSDAIGLLARDASASSGLVVAKQFDLGARATAADFEAALREAIASDDIDAVVAVWLPPLNTSAAEPATALAAAAATSTKPIVSTFLGEKGVPPQLRVRDASGGAAGRGSVPSYPAVESAVRALAKVVEYAVWLRLPQHEAAEVLVDPVGGREVVEQVLTLAPRGRVLEYAEARDLLAAYGMELWPSLPADTVEDAIAAASDLGWDVVLKATADRFRQRPDLVHSWRHIRDAGEMRQAWALLRGRVEHPDEAAFVVQPTAPQGVPVSITAEEDPLFGPVISFGIAGPVSELLGDRSWRIPPLSIHDARAMTREIKGSPMLFGYRGSDIVDVDAVEDLLLRVARLKNDLPQVHNISLPLVLASPTGASVLSASIRVQPVTDARADWFARRLNPLPGDTLH